MSGNKKIGVTTFWETNDNYGQLIQCWALQKYLLNQGHSPYLIRYTLYRPKKNIVKRIKAFAKKCIADTLYLTGLTQIFHLQQKMQTWTNRDLRNHRFDDFRKMHIVGSREIYRSLDALQSNPPEADVYITGSDQVWNFWMEKEHLKVYFLQFGADTTKRISYAASIGHPEFPEERQEEIKAYLSKFDAISMREPSAISVIKALGYEATQVVDPTMLLSAKDYETLIDEDKGKESVFIYSMNYASRDSIPFDEIKQYAADNKLPIIVTPGTGWVRACELFEGVEYSYATLPRWLKHIANAKLVITASFHGIVFSILFHRPFIYTPIKGTFAKGNNRVLDVLKLLGLEQRILLDERSFHKVVNAEINWVDVDDRLNKLRAVSVDFLRNTLK